MKRILCFLAASTAIVSANNAVAADYFNIDKPHNKGFVANGFWDNWEIQGGVGPTFNMGIGSGTSDAMGLGGYAAVGKWIHPVVGIRMVGEGGKFSQLTPAGRKSKWSYMFFHPDVMLDMTSWLGGYRPDRFWSTVLFLGGGVGSGAVSSPRKRTVQFVGNAGLQNRFRLGRAVSLDLTVEYMLADAEFRPELSVKSGRFHGLNATLGLTCRFNKRTFERSGIGEAEAKAMLDNLRQSADKAAEAQTVAQKAQAEANKQIKRANRAAEEVRRLEEENASLKERLKGGRTATEETSSPADSTATADAVGTYNEVLLYACGYSTLTNEHKKQLDAVAEHIKGTSDKVFCVDGFADGKTGSRQANARLAGKRARIAANYLISCGVDASRLKVGNCGTALCNIGSPAHNRIVAIY